MAKYGPKLEKEQIILGNFVDIGVDLFVMGSTLSYADYLVATNPADQSPQELADLFCREARRRIEGNFRAVKSNFNRSYNKVAGPADGRQARLAGRGLDQPDPAAVPRLGEERLRAPGPDCRPAAGRARQESARRSAA